MTWFDYIIMSEILHLDLWKFSPKYKNFKHLFYLASQYRWWPDGDQFLQDKCACTQINIYVCVYIHVKCESESCSIVSSSLWPHDYRVHGILQARILEWVASPFSRGSSRPRNRTGVSCIAGGFFISWATRKAHTRKHLRIFLNKRRLNFFRKCVRNNSTC